MRTTSLLLLTAAIALAGCSGSEHLQTVRVPPAPLSVNAETDTVEVDRLPPVPPRGVPTEPLRVTYHDSLPAPAAEVQRVTFTPGGTLGVLLASGTLLEYEPPRYGETFDWVAMSLTRGKARVRGQPEEEEVEAVVEEEEPNFFERFGSSLLKLLALIGAGAAVVLGIRLLR